MLTVCLSHDIDRTYKSYQYFTKAVIALLTGKVDGIKRQLLSLTQKQPYWTFPDLIEIETLYNVKSTFFFLNESISLQVFKFSTYELALGRYNIEDGKIVSMIKWLDENGWEIALHGSYNSYQNFELLKKEKSILEKIVGHEIIGIRQHYLNLNEDTWYFQRMAGFKYDSSWGFKNDIGFKESRIKPFHPLNDSFTVFPLTIMDTNFMEQSRRWELLELLIIDCIENNSPLVINFHQHVFNKYDFPEFRDEYIKLIEHCYKYNARFITMSEAFKEHGFSF